MKKLYLLLCFLFLAAALAACAAPPAATTAPTEAAPPESTPPSPPATTVPDDIYLTGLVVEKTEDDLFSQSILVARGTIHDTGSVIQTAAPSGLSINFTNYDFTISQIYRSSAEGSVTVRVEGGAVGGRNEIYEPTADLKDGKEYLLFLFQPNHGGNYYVDDDAYYVLGLNQGTFEPADGGYVSQSGAFLSEETLLARADEFPLDPDYFRREFLQNRQNNLDNGFITQEEYDRLVADVDVYAQIVETN